MFKPELDLLYPPVEAELGLPPIRLRIDYLMKKIELENGRASWRDQLSFAVRHKPELSALKRAPRTYRCGNYVFGLVMKEPWAQGINLEAVDDLWDRTHPFLKERGYSAISNPTVGDIVVYGKRLVDSTTLRTMNFIKDVLHFGIVRSNGQVRSKWGAHAIYTHDLNAIPTNYGEVAAFYRR